MILQWFFKSDTNLTTDTLSKFQKFSIRIFGLDHSSVSSNLFVLMIVIYMKVNKKSASVM